MRYDCQHNSYGDAVTILVSFLVSALAASEPSLVLSAASNEMAINITATAAILTADDDTTILTVDGTTTPLGAK